MRKLSNQISLLLLKTSLVSMAVIFSSISLAAVEAASQPLEAALVVTPQQVQDSVLNNFPLIEEATLKAEAARQKQVSAEGAFDTKLKVKSSNRFDDRYNYRDLETTLEKQLPVSGLKVFAGHHQGLGSIPAYTGKYETASAGEAFLGARLPLLRGRSIDDARFQRIEADATNNIAQAEMLVKKNYYVMKALETFQKWKLSQRKLDVKNTLLEIATGRQKMLEKQVKLGDVERIGLVDSRRSLLKRQAELIEAQNELDNMKAEMALYLRTKDGSAVALAQSKPALPIEVLKAPPPYVVRENPQISVLEKQRELQDRAIDLGRNRRLPLLEVEAAQFKTLSSSGEPDTSRLQVGLVFELPLENRKGRGEEAAARATKEAIERQRTYLARELETNLQQVVNTMQATERRLQLLEEELKSANTVADAERRRWRAGDSNLFMVAAREEEAANVEIRKWTAVYDFNTAEVEARFITADFVK